MMIDKCHHHNGKSRNAKTQKKELALVKGKGFEFCRINPVKKRNHRRCDTAEQTTGCIGGVNPCHTDAKKNDPDK